MSHIVVLAAGLGGLLIASEMKAGMRRNERFTVIRLARDQAKVMGKLPMKISSWTCWASRN